MSLYSLKVFQTSFVIIIIIIQSQRVFHSSICRRSFTTVWVTSLFRSSGLFSVLWCVQSRFFIWFSIPPVSFSKPLKIVPSVPVIIGITVTFICHSLFSICKIQVFVFDFHSVVHGNSKNQLDPKLLLLFFIIFLRIFHKSVSNKSLQISRTLLSILADLNNVLVCMVSILPLISRSSGLVSNPLGLVWFGLVYLFNGISTSVGYLVPNPSSGRTVVVLFNP